MKKKVETMITDETICIKNDCTACTTCYRHKEISNLGSDTRCFSLLNPASLPQSAEECPYYLEAVECKVAYGFRNMRDTVPRKAGAYIYDSIGLGCRDEYYRYQNGKKRILPDQQRYILARMKQYGADTSIGFDMYRTETVLLGKSWAKFN